METKSIMIVGVGGQGSLLASKLLGRLLVDEGYDVKVSEVHGMSQRGGSVVTYVRFGDQVYSPIVETGEADLIVSFEKIEPAAGCQFEARRRDRGKYPANRSHAGHCRLCGIPRRRAGGNDCRGN